MITAIIYWKVSYKPSLELSSNDKTNINKTVQQNEELTDYFEFFWVVSIHDPQVSMWLRGRSCLFLLYSDFKQKYCDKIPKFFNIDFAIILKAAFN